MMTESDGLRVGASEDTLRLDPRSGTWLERLVFNNRVAILVVCALITLGLGVQMTRLTVNASYERMIPVDHPFIQTYMDNRADLASQGNVLRVIVERTDGGSILDPAYLQTVQKVNDAVYLLPGVNRPYMMSIWTPNTRWLAVTEEGLEGGEVIDSKFDGSPAAMARLRLNIERSGQIGRLVATDWQSSLILAPLNDGAGHPRIDYRQLSQKLEEIRATHSTGVIRVRVVGFAKIVGDMIDGAVQVLTFFAFAVLISMAVVYWYTRCARSTVLVVACSLAAVVWQLGLLPLLGLELDPYSTLVPFLVFAIGMSHGSQKMNGVMQDIGRGADRLTAARLTFRRLFFAGFAALVCDTVGFAVLLIIKIEVIRELALTASLGVTILVFTNLILLPVLLSVTGVSPAAAQRSLRDSTDAGGNAAWRFLDLFTRRGWAVGALAASLAVAGGGWVVAKGVQIGDIDPGAPELRRDSRYNLDNAYLTARYATSTDTLILLVATPAEKCTDYGVLATIDALEWRLRQEPGVATTASLSSFARLMTQLGAEGNPKWFELTPNQAALNPLSGTAPLEFVNRACTLSQVRVSLLDHKAATLKRVIGVVQGFIADNPTPGARILLAAGNSGIEAATNMVVEEASRDMLYWVYGAVTLLCFVTFRSWRAVVCAILPLVLTSILAEALMAELGIGVKVATLPVIALGVGIGVDYALYIISILRVHLKTGASLSTAYLETLRFTGRVVLLTGVTLAVAVATWILSPIKFQADMGVLLAFCFLVNMAGALILVPALASVLLVGDSHHATPRPTPLTKDASVPAA
ncbi:efflux RND transporter permease subunit [Azospirillum griseum]|uniref:RND family transporter n=1 Tax=Azospirillum griseum TaxID=2496639 RepID=A0A3S0JEF0_9PROT|nr:MMPL family transporter [Azospirillum griseum]RTR14614.1 RND family transporter [Azospirillum griseum]